ncbi:eae-like domain protein [Citrobacter freundii]|uniref:eae-like domain protein n=1 Tax=Citrobacter freundii TaxID=546 RepID=UPI0015FB0386|nr:eae-like domain protein [Citrobacter freundii]MBA7989760.1 eae-like domain protein [Citrobacter freundii]
MGSNIIELAKLGHERAAELKASCGAVDVRSLAQLISDLATKLEVQFVRSTNMAVQLANAESKCRGLAAENAGLKAMCEDRRMFIMNGVQLGYIKVPTVESDPALETIRVAVSPQEPTPATDAFLAEVRAQGVDMYAEHLTRKTIESGENKKHAYAYLAANFAAQLRKGAAL